MNHPSRPYVVADAMVALVLAAIITGVADAASPPVVTLGDIAQGAYHTAPAGENRVLLVSVHARELSATLSSVSYGGQPMTRIGDLGFNNNLVYTAV